MEKVVNSYECTLIINATNGDEAAKATVGKFADTIAANAEVVDTAEWGRRRFAYPIEDMNEGYYVIFTFKCEGEFPAELQRLANIDEAVVRCMVVRLEYDAAAKKAAAKDEAVEETKEEPAEVVEATEAAPADAE